MRISQLNVRLNHDSQATGDQTYCSYFNLSFLVGVNCFFFLLILFWQKLDSHSPSTLISFFFKPWSRIKKCVFSQMPPLSLCTLPFHLFAISSHCSGSKDMATAAFWNPQCPTIILHFALAKELTWLCYRLTPRAKLLTIHGKLKNVVFSSYQSCLTWLLSLQLLLLISAAPYDCSFRLCNYGSATIWFNPLRRQLLYTTTLAATSVFVSAKMVILLSWFQQG